VTRSRRARMLHDHVDDALERGEMTRPEAAARHYRLYLRLCSGAHLVRGKRQAICCLLEDVLPNRWRWVPRQDLGGSAHVRAGRWGHEVVCGSSGQVLMTGHGSHASALRWAFGRGLLPVLSDEDTLAAMKRLGWGSGSSPDPGKPTRAP